MTYLVLDTETTIRNVGEYAIGKNKGSAFSSENFVVAVGYMGVDGIVHTSKDVNGFVRELVAMDGIKYLVGHNIKFDLHYLFRSELFRDWLYGEGIKIWDTQLVEYILSGQSSLYPSLNECSKKYGGTQKDDRIKEYWDNGIDTTDIPEEQLLEYLEYDVINTRTVFVEQVKIAKADGFVPLIVSQMDALLATTEMEWNGMQFDHIGSLRMANKLEKDLRPVEEFLRTEMEAAGMTDPNFNSVDQMSIFLFGGKQEYQEWGPWKEGEITLIKSGPNKGTEKKRKYTRERVITGRYTPDPEWKASKEGYYQVSNEILSKLGNDDVLNAIRKIRLYNKEINTYLRGYAGLRWGDGRIHHSLNHCATATGRLSCTKPNLQNCSNVEID